MAIGAITLTEADLAGLDSVASWVHHIDDAGSTR